MKTIPPSLLKSPSVFLATGMGSGLSPVAPGTVGSFAALLLFAFVQDTTWLLFIICLVGFILGVFICDQTSKKLGVHDHGGIVWDEFVGLWIAMLWIPFSWQNVALAFVLFRLFDIWKPWPIRALDKNVHGGLGIMIDDVLAGIFANLALLLLLRYFL